MLHREETLGMELSYMPDRTAAPTARRQALHKRYDPKPLRARIDQFLTERNESQREAGLRSGLDHQAVRRIMTTDQRPALHTCILLADHFGANPNEFLEMAGHPRMKVFDVKMVNTEQLPVEAVDVALDVARIPTPTMRKAMANAIRTLLKPYIES